MSTATVDFQQVKQAATPDQVMRYLGMTLKQHGDTWRGSCHLCKNSDPRAFLITDSKRLFHCFKCKARRRHAQARLRDQEHRRPRRGHRIGEILWLGTGHQWN